MDRLSFSDLGLRDLSAVPVVAHREHVAVEVLRAAWRRRRMCLGIALLAAGLAATFLITRPATYPAEAIIELHVGRADPAAGDTAAGVTVEASAIVLSEARIIRSRLISSRVVARLGLAEDPAFMREGRLTQVLERIETVLGLPQTARDPLTEAERRLSRSLSIDTDNRSHLISIRFTAARPDFAARVANTVAEEYLAHRLEATMDTAGHTATWLASQVATAEEQLRTADAAIRALRARTGVVQLGVTGDTLRQQEVRAVSTQLETLVAEWRAEEQRLLIVEAALRAGGAGAAASELSAVPSVLAAAQLAATTRRDFADVQQRLGPRHPVHEQALAAQTAAEAQLEAAVENALAVLRTGLAARRSAEASLRARLERLEQQVVAEASDQSELANLTGIATAARDRVLTLTRSRDQARAMRELRIVPASLIVPAQPPREASRPNLYLVSLAALIGGLLAGVALSALLERRDIGFRTTDEVTGATGLRCLSLVPERAAADPALTEPGWTAETPGQMMFDEAVRTVASSIGLFNGTRREGGQIVLVTSTLAGEGRSALCAGLVRALTLAGRRVLLIDGPPGRFGAASKPAAKPTQQQAQDKQAQDQQALANLPTGPSTSLQGPVQAGGTALDVFRSPDLGTVLEQARKHFDVIIIEGPPVLLVADSLVLGRMADSVLHAVHWSRTTQRDVKAALRRMQEHGVTVDGIVLTRVDVAAHRRLGLADAAAHHLSAHGYYARKAAAGAAIPLSFGRSA